jgi:cobalamin biosynthesis protein CobT
VSLLNNQELTARSIASNRNIEFEVDPQADSFKADIDRNVIIIPFSPRTFSDISTYRFRAGIDHESAHIKYTEPVNCTDDATLELLQAIEDGRVNKKISKKYKGCRANLVDFFEDVSNDFINQLNELPEDVHCQDYQIEKIKTFLYDKVWFNTSDFKLKHKYKISDDVFSKLNKTEIPPLNSTKDSLSLAKKIRDLFNFSEHSDQGDNPGNGVSEEDSENDSDSQEHQLKDDNNLDSSDSSSKTSDSNINQEKNNDEYNICSVNEKQDQIIEQQVDQFKNEIPESGIYNPYTDNDNLVSIEDETDKTVFDFDQSNLNKLRRRFMRDFQEWTEQKKRFRKKGRLDDFRTTELVTGVSDRIYKQKSEIFDLDTVVGFLVDLSGSMKTGRKIDEVRGFSYLLARSCIDINIPIKIIGYQTGCSTNTSSQSLSIDNSFNRKIPLKLLEIANFSDSFTHVKKNLARVNAEACDGLTIIGESIEFMEHFLLKRSEQNKVLFLLSDGKPTQSHQSNIVHKHFLDTVNRIKEENKVKLVGIDFSVLGYGSESFMDNYITDCIQFDSIDNFVEASYDKFKEIIKENVR